MTKSKKNFSKKKRKVNTYEKLDQSCIQSELLSSSNHLKRAKDQASSQQAQKFPLREELLFFPSYLFLEVACSLYFFIQKKHLNCPIL